MDRFERGLGPHYLTIYSIVRGLEVKAAVEFGAGPSTRAILQALETTDGRLWTCSPSTPLDPAWGDRCALYRGDSAGMRAVVDKYWPDLALDFVLHDGSHDEATVYDDIKWALGRTRQFGIVAVHDSEHSYSGPGVSRAIDRAISMSPALISGVTLPYAFGLTLLRVEARSILQAPMEPLTVSRRKVGSEHRSVPTPSHWGAYR